MVPSGRIAVTVSVWSGMNTALCSAARWSRPTTLFGLRRSVVRLANTSPALSLTADLPGERGASPAVRQLAQPGSSTLRSSYPVGAKGFVLRMASVGGALGQAGSSTCVRVMETTSAAVRRLERR